MSLEVGGEIDSALQRPLEVGVQLQVWAIRYRLGNGITQEE
jgi:hypothetical protein